MKKTFALIMIVSSAATSVFAQQDELKSATTNIEKQNYIAALDDISKAKKKVYDLMTDQLASVLPAKFGEFELSKKNDGGYGMDNQGISMTKFYRKPKPKSSTEGNPDMMEMGGMNEPMIQVMITNNTMMAGEVTGAHSMAEEGFDSGIEGVKTEAYRVKGYRAISKTSNKQEKPTQEQIDMGMDQRNVDEAHAVVGGAYISVSFVYGDGNGQAKTFLEQVDFDKLIGIVGK